MTLRDVVPEHLAAVLDKLEAAGAELERSDRVPDPRPMSRAALEPSTS